MAVIRQQTQVFNKPVGVVRSSQGSQQVAQAITRAAGKVADITFREAAEEAQKTGIEAARAVEAKRLTTFNPETGKPEAYEAPEGYGKIAAQAYQAVIEKRFEDSITEEMRIKAQEIALKYPYDAGSYSTVMSDYIAAMSENAGGGYAQYIKDTGSRFLASTRLNIQERAAARARQNLTQGIYNRADTADDETYNLAASGQFITVDGVNPTQAFIEKEAGNVTNGVTSGLIPNGSDAKARTRFNTSAARGAVDYILAKTKTSADRNAISLAIRTRGKNIDGVPEDLREAVTNLAQFIQDPDVAGDIVSHANTVSAEYDAVERDQIAVRKAEAERRTRQQLLGMDDSINNLSMVSSYIAQNAFTEIDESGQLLPYAVSSGVASIDSAYQRELAGIRSAYMNGVITDDVRKSKTKDARQSLFRPMLIEAAAQGNVEEFRVAAISNNPQDMAKLTPLQREFIAAMHSSNLFDPNEDTGFVREVVAGNINSVRVSREKERMKAQLFDEVSKFSSDAIAGNVDENAREDIIERINSEIGIALTADQREGLLKSIRVGVASGLIVNGTSNMRSTDLNSLSLFVDSAGKKRSNMTEAQIKLGQEIVDAIKPEDVDAVTGQIEGLRVKAKQKEDALEREATTARERARVLSGGGNGNVAGDRKIVDDILETAGIDLRDPSSQTAQVYSLLRSAPSEKMLLDLKKIADGGVVPGAETLLNHFARMYNDPTASGAQINRFLGSLSHDDAAFLNDVNEIRSTVGGNVADIAMMLRDRRNDPKSRIQAEITLGGKKPADFVTEYTDGFFSSPDPFIGKELAAVAEYYALTGKSRDEIHSRLGTIIDTTYAEAKYVADPRRPLGTMKRSAQSLEAMIPDDDDRTEFLRIIESQLPTGYSLFAKTYDANQALAQSQGMDAGNITGQKQVFLVPLGEGRNVTYLAHYVDDSNELKPLIYTPASRSDEPSQPVYPAFDLSELDDYRAKKAADEKIILLDQARSREQYYEQLRGTAREATVPMAVSPF